MKMECVVFGVPDGFQATETDSEGYQFVQMFYRPDKGTKTYIHKRSDDKVYYTRVIYPDEQKAFFAESGRPGAFLGITCMFDKSYCCDFEKLGRLFDRVYQNLVEKGYIQEGPSSRQFMINDLSVHQEGIYDAICKAIKSEVWTDENDFKPFTFRKLKKGEKEGVYRIHPSDMPRLNKDLMDSPYNIEISDKYPTQAMIRAKQSYTK